MPHHGMHLLPNISYPFSFTTAEQYGIPTHAPTHTEAINGT